MNNDDPVGNRNLSPDLAVNSRNAPTNPPSAPASSIRTLWMIGVFTVLIILAATIIAVRSRARTKAMLEQIRAAALDPFTTQMRFIKSGAINAGAEVPERVEKVKPFFLDVTEVTVAAYESCVRGKSCAPLRPSVECSPTPLTLADHPVTCVNQHEARSYCLYVGKRLPRESEWELGARSAGNRIYPWGRATPTEGIACFGRAESCSVATFIGDRSEGGVLDLAGNVAEWVEEEGITKGGSYRSNPDEMRAAIQRRENPAIRLPAIGFRCAK